jgi:transcriptional regulator with PAS, ATPase and Fis domain
MNTNEIELLIKKYTLKSFIDSFEREILQALLEKHRNVRKVATLCSITRQGLLKKIKKYSLKVSQTRVGEEDTGLSEACGE